MRVILLFVIAVVLAQTALTALEVLYFYADAKRADSHMHYVHPH